jgi:hypothetical protein
LNSDSPVYGNQIVANRLHSQVDFGVGWIPSNLDLSQDVLQHDEKKSKGTKSKKERRMEKEDRSKTVGISRDAQIQQARTLVAVNWGLWFCLLVGRRLISP